MPYFRRIVLFGLVLLCSTSLTVYAQEAESVVIDSTPFSEDESFMLMDDEPAPIAVPRRAVGGVGAIVQAIFSLMVVIGLIFITLHLLRKGSGNASVTSSSVTILAQQTLKAGASLLVVDVAGKVLILGVGDDVNLISEVTEQETIDQLRLNTPAPANTSFVSLLSAKLTQKGHAPTAKVSKPHEFLRKHTTRLTKPTAPDNNEESSL